MIDPARPFRQMARNNRLANLRLHRAVALLEPGAFAARRTGFFPSLQATLNHVLVVDWFYVDALEGGELGPKAFETDIPFPEPGPLAEAQAAVDDRLLALCLALRPEQLERPVDLLRGGGRIQRESLSDVLLHLFLHQTHHRGQAHAMLAGSPVPPPQLDEFITRDDARFRTAELAELGWTEADMTR